VTVSLQNTSPNFKVYGTYDRKLSRRMEGSIPDWVIRFFNLPNLSIRPMALGSTQPLTELSTTNFPGR
jgi:hypothetical protein